MKTASMIKAVIKSVPGIERVVNLHKTGGGATLDARYCYSVWLRHLILAHESGWTAIPGTVAELGPGDSLGVGIAALICGAEQYFAFDAVRYRAADVNLKVLDDLVRLFRERVSPPDERDFPQLKPHLVRYGFPGHILTPSRLEKMLSEDRLRKIRNAIAAVGSGQPHASEAMITYVAPWNSASAIRSDSVDMILSQAVLMHVDDLQSAYETMFKWLKPGGLMSHQIDFKSMGTAKTPFGHWEYSDLEWKILRGRRSYLINREPYSTHIRLLDACNFRIVREIKAHEETPADRIRLARRFQNLTPEDLQTSGLFVQAAKPAATAPR
jgi:SAM-dependent methyltransferase